MEILCIEKRVYSGRPGSFNCFISSFILVSQFGEVEIFRYFYMQVIWQRRGGKLDKTCHEAFCRIWISIFTQCVLYMWDFNSSTVDDACQLPSPPTAAIPNDELYSGSELCTILALLWYAEGISLLLAQVEHKYWFSIKILALDYVVV